MSKGPPRPTQRDRVVGLYTGGTLATEARELLETMIPAERLTVTDLGDDAFTVGRPHPMIDPEARQAPLSEALHDDAVAVVLIDVVLGYGAHTSPSAVVVDTLRAAPADRPEVVAYVCGTESDPQGYARQCDLLRKVGVIIGPSNADAARIAGALCAGTS